MNRDVNELSYLAVGAAIEVHRELGPGLLEKVYQECLCYELSTMGYNVSVEVGLPVRYKGLNFDAAYRVDMLVEDSLIIELKAVEKLLPVHNAQLLSYLKLSGKQLGLLMNFNVPQLKQGVKRVVNNF